ncbi:hypothetical protein [Cryptosporangium sp. NPDC048952]|uniref:hypothetical protein n=1 Tax=Cryptosporangium sp. NPDC048952 TaxID=3363961 RepID=UPI003723C0E7
MELGVTAHVPLAPVNTPQTIGDDPQFASRMLWPNAAVTGTEMMPTPICFPDDGLRAPTRRKCCAPSPATPTTK